MTEKFSVETVAVSSGASTLLTLRPARQQMLSKENDLRLGHLARHVLADKVASRARPRFAVRRPHLQVVVHCGDDLGPRLLRVLLRKLARRRTLSKLGSKLAEHLRTNRQPCSSKEDSTYSEEDERRETLRGLAHVLVEIPQRARESSIVLGRRGGLVEPAQRISAVPRTLTRRPTR